MLAAGCACDATERVVRGEDTQAVCLVRPPGHHAMIGHALGFCIFNNIAVAARTAIDSLGLNRVLIVDWDVHHCNGTQATFWEDPQVGVLSIHRWPFYPGTGDEDEIGGGPGLGTTLNLPVQFGTPRKDYLTRFCDNLDRFAAQIKPELVLISAGYDTHRVDPVGNLGLETEDFITLTNAVLDVASTYADGRVISVLEGGYNPDALADCITVHVEEMLKRTKT
jgi:acetoin utilization deacetylase AcuC-like enzyme